METLEEAVLDQSQVVTYKWLCHKLGTTANKAKQLLFAFTETQRKLGTQLEIMYLVAGMMKADPEVHSVSLVPFSKLHDVKSKYSLVTSVHVYSVHKNPIRDSDILYSVDCDLTSTLDVKRASAIVCKSAKLRSGKLVEDESDPPVEQQMISKNNDTDANVSTAAKPSFVNVKRKDKSNNITSMFSSMASKKHTNSVSSDSPGNKVTVKEEAAVVQKATKAYSVSDAPMSKQKAIAKTTKNIKSETLEDQNKKGNIKGQDKRKKNKDHSDLPKKRRRRIIEMSDSSEEDVDEDRRVSGDSESPFSQPRKLILEDESKDTPEEPLPASRLKSKKNDTNECTERSGRRPCRRLIEKTVKDEDGYLSTQKMWVEYSDGEDSDDENAKQRINVHEVEPEKGASKPPNAAYCQEVPLKNKQAMLTSFFKRK